LFGCPQRRGICLKVNIMAPKKPNSADRKVAKVRLTTKRKILAYISGMGHSVQEHSSVLVRGGRVRDLPGMHYKLVKGKLDFSWKEIGLRNQGRSKYGTPSLKGRKMRKKKKKHKKKSYKIKTFMKDQKDEKIIPIQITKNYFRKGVKAKGVRRVFEALVNLKENYVSSQVKKILAEKKINRELLRKKKISINRAKKFYTEIIDLKKKKRFLT